MKFLHVFAKVRYWEDATINDVSTESGEYVPFKVKDIWKPIIDLEKGSFVGWPEGTKASIHFKVCDAGEYFLSEDGTNVTRKYDDDYVPDSFLCHKETGYGDYIIMDVDERGMIQNYKRSAVTLNEWPEINQKTS